MHFVLPFVVVGLMFIHLYLLHGTGSSSSVGLHASVDKVSFHPFFVVKDRINVIVYLAFMVGILLFPYSMGEVELYEDANPISSPAHIVPE